ncbi:MAG: prepilin-type N-terminal cleavage/methylation domain-containing protein [Armatimonadota bacterium]
MRKSARGFTLIEMLVVIAIICILSAMLFPVWETVMKQAEGASCLSQLRSIGFAAKMYAADFDGRLVPARVSGAPPGYLGIGWGRILAEYMRNRELLICPTDPAPTVATGTWGVKRSYGINYELCMVGGYNNSSLTLAAVESETETILFMETDSTQRCLGMAYPLHGLSRIAARHNDRCNFTFCDGHAKLMTPRETVKPTNLWDLQ